MVLLEEKEDGVEDCIYPGIDEDLGIDESDNAK